MQEGLYKVEFHTVHGTGNGLLYATSGKLRGGNSGFAFVGNYTRKGNEIHVKISTLRHNPDPGFKALFGIDMITLTLTGMQIKNMLEQQWIDPKRPRILQVSRGFSYAWDATKPYGEHVIADRMSLNGQRIDPAASYRVTVNNYLALGGDGFTVLKDGTAQRFGGYDVDALYAYFQAHSPVSPATTDRIARLN